MLKWIAVLCAAVLGGSCGGGGGDDGIELILEGIAGLDGTIRLQSDTGQCEIDPVQDLLQVGESGNLSKFVTYWGFVTFDLTDIPAGATILSATARIRLSEVEGDNVFAPGFFGNVVMEHIDIGMFLDPPDMDSPSLSGELVGGDASPTFLASDGTLGDRSVDIEAEVERDLADGRTRTTLRLRLQVIRQTDNDNQFDAARFVGYQDSSGTVQPADQRPRLIVRYRMP